MIRRPPVSTRTATLFPSTTLVRSGEVSRGRPDRWVAPSRRQPAGGYWRPLVVHHGPRGVFVRLLPSMAAACSLIANLLDDDGRTRDGRADRKSTRLNSSH